MEKKIVFLVKCLHRRSVSGYDQNHLFISDISRGNKHLVISKLMVDSIAENF